HVQVHKVAILLLLLPRIVGTLLDGPKMPAPVSELPLHPPELRQPGRWLDVLVRVEPPPAVVLPDAPVLGLQPVQLLVEVVQRGRRLVGPMGEPAAKEDLQDALVALAGEAVQGLKHVHCQGAAVASDHMLDLSRRYAQGAADSLGRLGGVWPVLVLRRQILLTGGDDGALEERTPTA